MKLKDIVEMALIYLGDDIAVVDENIAKTHKLLLLERCSNIVLKEIANDYLPLKDNICVDVENNYVEYGNFNFRVAKIVKIKDQNNNIVDFVQRPDRVEMNTNGKLCIDYYYIPYDKTMNEECEIMPCVQLKTIALGVCAEFCLIEGRYEESVMFREKFEQDMDIATRKKKEIIMSNRKWN